MYANGDWSHKFRRTKINIHSHWPKRNLSSSKSNLNKNKPATAAIDQIGAKVSKPLSCTFFDSNICSYLFEQYTSAFRSRHIQSVRAHFVSLLPSSPLSSSLLFGCNPNQKHFDKHFIKIFTALNYNMPCTSLHSILHLHEP